MIPNNAEYSVTLKIYINHKHRIYRAHVASRDLQTESLMFIIGFSTVLITSLHLFVSDDGSFNLSNAGKSVFVKVFDVTLGSLRPVLISLSKCILTNIQKLSKKLAYSSLDTFIQTAFLKTNPLVYYLCIPAQ